MCEELTPEEKVEIVESFNDYTSWIDDEGMGPNLVEQAILEVAEQHQIPSSTDLDYLFWSEEPFATQAANALDDLRNKYGQRMQQAFRDEVVKTDSEYEDFVEQEKNSFSKDWESAVKSFDWSTVQDNAINTLLDKIAPEFPDTDVNELRQKLIELYPDCSAYDVTGDEAVSKLQDIMGN